MLTEQKVPAIEIEMRTGHSHARKQVCILMFSISVLYSNILGHHYGICNTMRRLVVGRLLLFVLLMCVHRVTSAGKYCIFHYTVRE